MSNGCRRRETNFILECLKVISQVKAVCQVYLGAVEDDGMFTAVQALCDQDFDNFASACFINDSVFVVIAVLIVSFCVTFQF